MSLEPQLRLAVLEDNRFVFGDSEMRLLEAIGREGTLAEGAATLGLSYRVAWGKLRALEAALGRQLVQRTVGGPGGGSSKLTQHAQQLVEQYGRYREAVGEFALNEFKRCFGDAEEHAKLVGTSQRPAPTTERRMASGVADSELAGESL